MSFVIEPYTVKTTTTSTLLIWVMLVGTPAGNAQIVKYGGGGEQTVVSATHTPTFTGLGEMNPPQLHYAQFNSLEPYTRYNYTVNADDGSTTGTGTFTTMRIASDNGPTSWIISGDQQNTYRIEQWECTLRMEDKNADP